MFQAYGLAAMYACLGCGLHPVLSPFAGLWFAWDARQNGEWPCLLVASGYVAIQAIAVTILLVAAVKRIRWTGDRRTAPRRPPPTTASPRPSLPRTTASPATTSATGAVRPPISDEAPFDWKEQHVRGSRETADDEAMQTVFRVMAGLAALVIGLMALQAVLRMLVDPNGGSGSVAVSLGAVAAFIQILSIAAFACGTVVRERQWRTLETLQSLPIERIDLLRAKWRVAIGRGWPWLVPGAILIASGLAYSGLPLAAVMSLGYLPGLAMLTAALGLLLSTRCLAMTRAMMIAMSILGALVLVPLVICWVCDPDDATIGGGVMVGFTASVWLAEQIVWRRAVQAFEDDGR
jgi:hypothetical protein